MKRVTFDELGDEIKRFYDAHQKCGEDVISFDVLPQAPYKITGLHVGKCAGCGAVAELQPDGEALHALEEEARLTKEDEEGVPPGELSLDEERMIRTRLGKDWIDLARQTRRGKIVH